MFTKAAYGITFSKETIEKVRNQMYSLASEHEGAHPVLNLFAILYDLSLSKSSSRSFNINAQNYESRCVERAYNYMLANYNVDIRLLDVANLVGMTVVSFSRFLKQRTGRNFIDSLNDIRLGHATRMSVDTTDSVAEIAVQCGFSNLSNFNRIFKKKKQCTPREFREYYKESRFFV